jgi:hypothetical protein
MSTVQTISLLRSGGLSLCAAGTLLLFASQGLAAEHGKAFDAQAAYQRDRAACMSGASNQDRATCLKEAGAALQEAKRGALDTNTDRAQFEANRLQRCDNQPAGDREDCIRRMNGEGTTRGSVQSGGIYRELVTPVDPAKRD